MQLVKKVETFIVLALPGEMLDCRFALVEKIEKHSTRTYVFSTSDADLERLGAHSAGFSRNFPAEVYNRKGATMPGYDRNIKCFVMQNTYDAAVREIERLFPGKRK